MTSQLLEMKKAYVISFWGHLKEPAAAGDGGGTHLSATPCTLVITYFSYTRIAEFLITNVLFSLQSSQC